MKSSIVKFASDNYVQRRASKDMLKATTRQLNARLVDDFLVQPRDSVLTLKSITRIHLDILARFVERKLSNTQISRLIWKPTTRIESENLNVHFVTTRQIGMTIWRITWTFMRRKRQKRYMNINIHNVQQLLEVRKSGAHIFVKVILSSWLNVTFVDELWRLNINFCATFEVFIKLWNKNILI